MLLGDDIAYLNTGSYGPTPRVVFDKLVELRRELAAEPVAFLWRTTPALLRRAREQLAAYIGGEARQLIFTVNVTAAINLVAASLQLAAPGEILIGSMEYGSMRYCWERSARRQGLTLRRLALPVRPAGTAEIIEAVEQALRPRTRLLFLSHVFYTTGVVAPVREICALARRRGVLTVIDAAHAPGMIPVSVAEVGSDFYAANLHKWLLAPIGAGFLYVRPGNEDRLQPLGVSWGYQYDRRRAHDWDEFGGTPWIRSFEFEGTRDPCPWLAVPAAIDFHQTLGPEQIRRRHRELSDYVRRRLHGLGGLQLVTPDHPALRGALTAFRMPPADFEAVRSQLWTRHRIEVPIIEHAEGNFLRVSTHFYNFEEEVDRLAAALAELLPPAT